MTWCAMPSTKVALNLRLDAELHTALKELAVERKRSLNNLIEVILDMAVMDAPEPLIAEIERRTA